MDARNHSIDDLLIEHLMVHGLEGTLTVFTVVHDTGMRAERKCFTGNLVADSLRGTEFIVSGDNAEFRPARQAIFLAPK